MNQVGYPYISENEMVFARDILAKVKPKNSIKMPHRTN